MKAVCTNKDNNKLGICTFDLCTEKIIKKNKRGQLRQLSFLDKDNKP